MILPFAIKHTHRRSEYIDKLSWNTTGCALLCSWYIEEAGSLIGKGSEILPLLHLSQSEKH